MNQKHSFAHTPLARPRTQPVRAIVLHTTGGIRDPYGVYSTLLQRRCSIHYIVGVDGLTLQCAPHSMECRHAGAVNPWTIGIEMCSPLLRGTEVEQKERKKLTRRVYSDRVRGRKVRELVALTDAQMAAAVLLVETLTDQLRLPRRVPVEADGALLRRRMTDDELASFSGTMGHYHSHEVKLDPGTDILDELRRRWHG